MRGENKMEAYLLYHPKAADVTGPRLAKAMGIQGGSRPPAGPVDVLIRYGSREICPWIERVVNNAGAIARAIDKRGSLLVFLEHGVAAPRPEDHPSVLPAIGRKKRHERGSGFWLCLQEMDARDALAQGAEYFIPYIPTRNEYRVHVVGGTVPFMQLKEPSGKPKHRLFPWLRNKNTGWRLIRCPEISEVSDLGIRAVAALGLDFGAVDILRSDSDELYVLEVNTAPALRGAQLVDWSNSLRRLLQCAE